MAAWHLLLAAVILGSITAGTAASAVSCDPAAAAASFAGLCASGGPPSQSCCNLLNSTGLNCLCSIAEARPVVASGYSVESLLATYKTCGGRVAVAAGCSSEETSVPAEDSTSSQHKSSHHHHPTPQSSHHHHPTPHRSHHHRKKRVHRHRKSGPEDATPTELLKSKVEAAGLIIVMVVVPVAVLALAAYVVCAGPGNRLARARLLMELLSSVLVSRGAGQVHPTTGMELAVDPLHSALGVPARSAGTGVTGTGGAMVPSEYIC